MAESVAVERLESHVCGAWTAADGEGRPLHNPTTGEVVATATTAGVDYAACLAYARDTGGPALRAMTYSERGQLLQGMADALHGVRDELIGIAITNGGNTRGDAKFDIDGAMFTLAHYAKLAEGMDAGALLADGDAIRLGRSPRFVGQHVFAPRLGVAVHINAFNFPAWGFAEKAAVALLAGMPVVTKPGTSSAALAVACVKRIVDEGVLPAGALSLLTGSVGDLLDHLGPQDVLAFTGSADTGCLIRSTEALLRGSVRVSVEADSLNACVLGADVEPESATWDMFVRETAREMTQKAGQKCTATRRILVPEAVIDLVGEALAEELARTRVGDPSLREVRMGPLATEGQLSDVMAGIERLQACTTVVYAGGEAGGTPGRGPLVGIEGDGGWFVSPTLLRAADSDAADIHAFEIFGPVATLLPFDGSGAEAARIIGLGQGCLVSSIYSDDAGFIGDTVRGASPWLGRIHIGSAKVAEHSPGPGGVNPALIHGGPGRAGGGEELGGPRGLAFYMQRTALQGDQPLLAGLLD